MKEQDFLQKINDIDDDLVDEAASAGKVRRFPIAKVLVAAACFVICAVAAIGIGNIKMGSKANQSENAIAADSENKEEYAVEENCEGEAVDENAYDNEVDSFDSAATSPEYTPETEITTEETAQKKSLDGNEEKTGKSYQTDGSKAGEAVESCDGDNWFFIPAVPKKKVKVTGEKITDAEGKEYLDERRNSLAESLSASGVPTDNIVISDKGYSHLCYDGSTMEYIELRQNYRDYLVYNNGDLIAIVTLHKENGKIYDTPVFGASWFSSYNSFLNSHKGQKLVYVYAKNLEIIISPDGKCYSVLGTDTKRYFEGIDNPYSYFYNDDAVYIPQ